MKFIYSLLLAASSFTLLHAQQSFSSFPVSIDKGDYDDREALFVSSDNVGTGIFISDHSAVNFIKLTEGGEQTFSLKQNMPLNYSSLKRAGSGTLGNNFFFYLLQGTKKIFAYQADAQAKTLTYSAFPFTAENPILFFASGQDYVYVVTSSGAIKNELTVYKYTALGQPTITKIKTEEADIYKAFSINTNKAVEQIAVLPLNTAAHFTQTALVTKCYHDADHLILTYDAPEGDTRILTISGETSTYKTVKSGQTLDKKSIFKSILYADYLFQLSVTAQGIAVKQTNLADNTSVNTAELPGLAEPDFYYESSYSNRIGYNRARKAATKADLYKSFQRSDNAGLGILESTNNKLLLVAGLTNRNNIADPALENSDNTQKGTLDVNMVIERNYNDLHLPSYSNDQEPLMKFKKEIWVYTYWTLDVSSLALSKSSPEDVPALDESLDLYYRDPLNNVAPAVWKQPKSYLFGYYNSKNALYNLFRISSKPAGGNMNRR